MVQHLEGEGEGGYVFQYHPAFVKFFHRIFYGQESGVGGKHQLIF